MDLITVFVTTFILVFIGELGDKTQIAAGVGTLANRKQTKVIFLSSALALIAVSGLTVFFAGLIPETYLPTIKKAGGVALIVYGVYLYFKKDGGVEEESLDKSVWLLFLSHFSVVFIAEIGDKTQMFTLAAAIENNVYLLMVFIASATALITVTAGTVWGITRMPAKSLKWLKVLGIIGMFIYGLYMIFF